MLIKGRTRPDYTFMLERTENSCDSSVVYLVVDTVRTARFLVQLNKKGFCAKIVRTRYLVPDSEGV